MDLELILRMIIITFIQVVGFTAFLVITFPKTERLSYKRILIIFSFLYLCNSLVPFISIDTRLYFHMMVLILTCLVFLRYNILQSFIITFICLVAGLIIDTGLVIILQFTLKIPVERISQGFNFFILMAALFMAAAYSTFACIIKNKIKVILIKRSYLKKYQITIPLMTIIMMFLYTFWINFYIAIGNTQSSIVQIMMLTVILIISGVVLYVSDQYMKNKNENLVLKARLSSLTNHSRNQSNQVKSKSEFEKSVEFDLFSSGFGEKISEEYQLNGVLYESENSLIYKLTGMDSNDYTLKAISKEKMESVDFKRLQALNINRVASLIEYADTSQFHYFLKPFIEGINLHEHVNANGPMAENQLVDVLEQLMNIISALHEHTEPLIYRDIKPSNLIIDKDGRLHLIDIETIRKSNAKREMDTILIATKGFTAPEQYGFSQSHEKSDIFSIGATAYFLATGKMPHYDQVHDSNFADHQNVSSKLMAFIRKCMQFNPEDRYASVKEANESI